MTDQPDDTTDAPAYDPTVPLPTDDTLAHVLDGIPDEGHRQIVQLVWQFAARQADLEELGATARQAIEDSATDRADLRTQLDALTARLDALTPPTT